MPLLPGVPFLVAHGGTGRTSVTSGNLLVGAGTAAMTELAPGAAAGYVRSNGSAWVRSTIQAGDLPDLSGTYSVVGHTHAHSALTGIGANDHHAQSHVLADTSALGTDHTVSGLTARQVLIATGATAAKFRALEAADLPDVSGTYVTIAGSQTITGDKVFQYSGAGIGFTIRRGASQAASDNLLAIKTYIAGNEIVRVTESGGFIVGKAIDYKGIIGFYSDSGGLWQLYPASSGASTYNIAMPARSGWMNVVDTSGPAAGSIPYGVASSPMTTLGIGAANYIMRSTGSAPEWVSGLQVDSNNKVWMTASISGANNVEIRNTHASGLSGIDFKDSANALRGWLYYGSGSMWLGAYNSANLLLQTNNQTRLSIDNAGAVGIGGALTVSGSFNAQQTYSSPTSDIFVNDYEATISNGSLGAGWIYHNLFVTHLTGSTATSGFVNTIYSRPYMRSSGNVGYMRAVASDPYFWAGATGAVTEVIGLHASPGAYGGGATSLITSWSQIKIDNPGAAGAGKVAYNTGLYISAISGGTSANYAIYSAGGASYHEGDFQFGGNLLFPVTNTTRTIRVNASATGNDGLSLTLQAGAAGAGAENIGGALYGYGGAGGPGTTSDGDYGGAGGPVTFTGGTGGISSVNAVDPTQGGSGGDASFLAGTGGAGSGADGIGGNGGWAYVSAGQGGAGTTNGSAGDGGSLVLSGGYAGGTGLGSAAGGSVYVYGGVKHGSGQDGNVILARTEGGTKRGNVGIGTSGFGSSAVGVLAIANGTQGAALADVIQLVSEDLSAGNTIPSIRTEGTGITGGGLVNVVPTTKIAVKVNGTVYYLLATTLST